MRTAKDSITRAENERPGMTAFRNTEAAMQRKEVTDLYEAAYLVLNGGRLEEVGCIPLSASLACKFTFAGENLSRFQEQFYRKEAEVNLHAFRSAYTQVNGFMREAKKAWERERRAIRRDGGQAGDGAR
jgi:hypothetical protein